MSIKNLKTQYKEGKIICTIERTKTYQSYSLSFNKIKNECFL